MAETDTYKSYFYCLALVANACIGAFNAGYALSYLSLAEPTLFKVL
jgi:hypothetical protein